MTGRRRNTGLTLLEVILAISLMVMLCGSIYGFHYYALIRRGETHARAEAIFAQRRILDLVTAEVQSAIVYPMLATGMEGQADKMEFMQQVVPTNAVFYEPSVLDAPSALDEISAGSSEEPQHDIQLVGYRLYVYEDEEGEEQVGGLERTCKRTLSSQVSEEGENIEVALLTESVKYLNIQYFDGRGWATSWQGGDLPLAIRIEVGERPLEEEMTPEEYPYETMWRVVAIPSGGPSLMGGGGRGGGRGSGGGRFKYEGEDVYEGGDIFKGDDVYKGGDVFKGTGGNRGGGR